MSYFRQRTETDCLLTVLECLIDMPREELDPIEYYPFENGKDYFSYRAAAEIIKKQDQADHFGAYFYHPTCNAKDIELGVPAIVAIGWLGVNNLHAMFFDGERLFNPSNGEFSEIKDHRVSYIISRPSIFNNQRWPASWVFERMHEGSVNNVEVLSNGRWRAKESPVRKPDEWLKLRLVSPATGSLLQESIME